MKKRKAVLAVLLTAGMLTGCLGRGGGSINTESSRIFVTEEGTFQTATVESYTQQDYYSGDELKSFLDEAVLTFNKDSGQNQVALDSCELDNGTAKMVFHYTTPEALIKFASQYEDKENLVDSIAVVSFDEVLGQSESEGVTFYKASDGKEADQKALSKKGDSHVVVVSAANPVTIQTQGKILFVSGNVEMKDSHTVQTAQGKNYIIFK